jgi:hypothetical protein
LLRAPDSKAWKAKVEWSQLRLFKAKKRRSYL